MVILLFACILSRHNGWVCKIFTLNCLVSLLESEANINRVGLIGLRNFASDSLAMFCFTEGIQNLLTKFHKAVYQDFRGGEHHHFKQLERKAEKKLCALTGYDLNISCWRASREIASFVSTRISVSTLRSRGNKTHCLPRLVTPPYSTLEILCWTPAGTQICRGFREHDLITCESKFQVVISLGSFSECCSP